MYKCTLFKKNLLFVVVLLAISLLITSCASEPPAPSPTPAPEPEVSQFEMIREAADIYLSSGKTPNISAEELYTNLADGDPDNDPFILSVRSPEQYTKGHIPGAVNIPWREVAKEENLAELPKDRQIIVYCYTGHTASQVTSLLNILGYDAINLKFGMTAWTLDKDIAPGRYEETEDGKNYPIVRGAEPEGTQEIP